jgi:hypothetical protein
MGTTNIENDISAINNNTTIPDTSMNTTQIELLKKLSKGDHYGKPIENRE